MKRARTYSQCGGAPNIDDVEFDAADSQPLVANPNNEANNENRNAQTNPPEPEKANGNAQTSQPENTTENAPANQPMQSENGNPPANQSMKETESTEPSEMANNLYAKIIQKVDVTTAYEKFEGDIVYDEYAPTDMIKMVGVSNQVPVYNRSMFYEIYRVNVKSLPVHQKKYIRDLCDDEAGYNSIPYVWALNYHPRMKGVHLCSYHPENKPESVDSDKLDNLKMFGCSSLYKSDSGNKVILNKIINTRVKLISVNDLPRYQKKWLNYMHTTLTNNKDNVLSMFGGAKSETSPNSINTFATPTGVTTNTANTTNNTTTNTPATNAFATTNNINTQSGGSVDNMLLNYNMYDDVNNVNAFLEDVKSNTNEDVSMFNGAQLFFLDWNLEQTRPMVLHPSQIFYHFCLPNFTQEHFYTVMINKRAKENEDNNAKILNSLSDQQPM